jgi:hypothetical protein
MLLLVCFSWTGYIFYSVIQKLLSKSLTIKSCQRSWTKFAGKTSALKHTLDMMTDADIAICDSLTIFVFQIAIRLLVPNKCSAIRSPRFCSVSRLTSKHRDSRKIWLALQMSQGRTRCRRPRESEEQIEAKRKNVITHTKTLLEEEMCENSDLFLVAVPNSMQKERRAYIFLFSDA